MTNKIKENDLIVIVRIRGIRNLKPKIKKTLDLLKLNKVNHAVVYKVNDSLMGMINNVKDYVAFGKISKETLKKLVEKRGEKGSKRALEVYDKNEVEKIVEEIESKGKTDKIDGVFRLHPPRRGWKNIKAIYPRGDAGFREDMDEIIRRMM